MLTTDSAAVGMIRVEPELLDIPQHDGWDDSTLDTVLVSFAHCVPAEGVSCREQSSGRRVTLARYSRFVTADLVQKVVRANRTQLLRDLEAEYSQLCGRLEG
jgi:hypothetical protein